MHPAHVVSMAFADELRVIVVHPVRIRLPEAGPFVARALRVALQVNELVVDINAARAGASFELRLAEPSYDPVNVDCLPVHLQDSVDLVKVRISRAPEAGAPQRDRKST